jgi:lipopolysaccharide export system permease protein
VRTDILTQVIQPGRFSSPEQGLTFHIRDRAPSGELLGVVMHDATKGSETKSYLAERALVVKKGDNAYVIMSDGHYVHRPEAGDASKIAAFKKYIIDLDKLQEKESEVLDLKPRERFLGELMWPEETSSSFKSHPGQFRAELHERFASPFYPIAFVLIALATVGQAQSTRQNRVEKIVAGFTLATATRFAGLAANNIVVTNSTLTGLLYAIPIGSALIAAGMMVRLSRPHATFSLGDRLHDLAAPIAARLRALRSSAASAAARRRGS